MASNADKRQRAKQPDQVQSIGPEIEAAGGRRVRKLHGVEIFTERRAARPGPWLPFDSSRVAKGRYDSGLRQIQVEFADGTPWVYEEVPRNVWHNMRRSASPGRYINRVLNGYPYRRGPDVWPDAQEGEADVV